MLQEGPLRLREGAIGAGDEEHQVAAGHEVAADGLMLAQHGVGARRVHDVDLPQELGRVGEHPCAPVVSVGLGFLAVAQNVDLSRSGRDPLSQVALAQQGVDQRRLAAVELANHHEQEELVQLLDGFLQNLNVFGVSAPGNQHVDQAL